MFGVSYKRLPNVGVRKKKMSIARLSGLGPKSQQMLAKIGVLSDAEFLAADPYELYRLLKHTGVSVSLNLLYGMIAAQENKDWKVVKQEQKTTILMRLDDMGLAPKK